MADFAIMRVQKIKGGASMNGSISHITRARETPNADASRRHLNRAIVGEDNAKAIRKAIASRTPPKYRRDAVRSLEFVLTASPEWFVSNHERTEEYLESAVGWVKDELGEENVVSAVIHYDETTPHVHVHAVPLVEETNRLSAKSFIDGRSDLGRMQSRFAEWQAGFGVQRGVSRTVTQRDHTTIAEWSDGHSQLDDRESSLEKREQQVKAHQKELGDADWQRLQQLKNLDDREASLEKREQALEETTRQQLTQGHRLSEREKSLVPREQELETREQAQASRIAKRAAQLEPRERQLAEREAFFDSEKSEFQKQKAAWVEANRPPSLPPLVRHLQHLQTLGRSAAAEYLNDQDSDELYASFDALQGLTKEGKTYMAQYVDAAERVERWERDIEPPSSPAPGL